MNMEISFIRFGKKNKSAQLSWHLDETYIKVRGEWLYLYRAIDKDGHTLDIQLRKKRDHQATYAFMKKIVKTFGEPTVSTTDKAPVLLCAFNTNEKHKVFINIQFIA